MNPQDEHRLELGMPTTALGERILAQMREIAKLRDQVLALRVQVAALSAELQRLRLRDQS